MKSLGSSRPEKSRVAGILSHGCVISTLHAQRTTHIHALTYLIKHGQRARQLADRNREFAAIQGVPRCGGVNDF